MKLFSIILDGRTLQCVPAVTLSRIQDCQYHVSFRWGKRDVTGTVTQYVGGLNRFSPDCGPTGQALEFTYGAWIDAIER